MDDEEEEDGPAMGGRPKHLKQPNPRNEPRRERERKQKEEQDRALVQGEHAMQEEAQQAEAQQNQAQQVQLESKIPVNFV